MYKRESAACFSRDFFGRFATQRLHGSNGTQKMLDTTLQELSNGFCCHELALIHRRQINVLGNHLVSLFCRLFKYFLNGQFGDAQRKRPARKALIYPMNQKAVGCQLNDLDRRQQMAPKAEAPGDIFFFNRPHSSGRRPTERSKVVRSDKSRTFVPCADVLV